MDTALPPVIGAPVKRRSHVSLKLLFIALLVLVLHVPLTLINDLRQERAQNRAAGEKAAVERREVASETDEAAARRAPQSSLVATEAASGAAEGYRMVERALKHSVLVLTLVFTAFFLFETLTGLRLHAVHYGLVGAALCLFYLALLALGEVLEPGWAYVGAAVASSLLIVGYSASILRSYARAASIAALLASEHSVLYVVLRMENYALLAGTGALFAVLAALMWFTRNVDWFAQEVGKEARG
ncbi:MAG: inner membrane CreD family protein [Candidatus Didemnitutus sp.]|nr:inner membrane CreD family protein [Candidatus Didemnitutus sp.]